MIKNFTSAGISDLTDKVMLVAGADTADGFESQCGVGLCFGPSRFGELSGPANQVKSSDASKDPDKAKRLWDLSVEMTGIDQGV